MSSFNQTVRSIRGGSLETQLSDKMTEVVQSVKETGKVGEITLTLRFKPNGDAIIITPSVKTKVPEPTVGDALFFADDNGNLLNRDPKQMDIDEFTRKKEAVQITAKTGD